jgi:hypothetical protein
LAELVTLVQFTTAFVAGYWSVLFLMPLKAAHYEPDGHLVVRRIFLGNLFHGLLRRRVRRNGSNLVFDVGGREAIVGGSAATASLVSLLVVPWVGPQAGGGP